MGTLVWLVTRVSSPEERPEMDRPDPALPRETAHALRGEADSIRQARDHARDFFTVPTAPITPDYLADILLVVSELVTNAVRHAPGPCTLLLREDRRDLTISVSDTGSGTLTRREPDVFGPAGGYGWHLLHRLGSQVSTTAHPGGKSTIVSMPRCHR
jgi:anti-sigma regulatory factor (Ser/Thr protein kinase)